MMVKIMSNSKRIKGKVHFYVSRLAGAVQSSKLWECQQVCVKGLKNSITEGPIYIYILSQI